MNNIMYAVTDGKNILYANEKASNCLLWMMDHMNYIAWYENYKKASIRVMVWTPENGLDKI